MQVNKYLQLLQSEIHSTVVATVDCEGKPCTCVIDMMLVDEGGLYFLTAKGKAFYDRLVARPDLSVTGFVGTDTLHARSVTVQGRAREIGHARLSEIFQKNPYMSRIYPSPESQMALSVFQIYEGKGEFFDLSTAPIFRESFSFGGVQAKKSGYTVRDGCIGCKLCLSVCPQKSIDVTSIPVRIEQSHCLHCGRCAEICPKQVIGKQGDKP